MDKIVIQLNNNQYWLYVVVRTDINILLRIIPEPTTNKVTAHMSFVELREECDVDGAVFLIDDLHLLKNACRRYSLNFRYERYGTGTRPDTYLIRQNKNLLVYQDVLPTPKQTLWKTDFKDSASSGIG